jgi:hypothetical protein
LGPFAGRRRKFSKHWFDGPWFVTYLFFWADAGALFEQPERNGARGGPSLLTYSFAAAGDSRRSKPHIFNCAAIARPSHPSELDCMSDTMTEPQSVLSLAERESPEWQLLSLVSGILGSLYPESLPNNQRRQRRLPFPHLVYVTPVGPDGETPVVGTLVAAGKHLSESGLGFYHPDPILFRQAIVSLEQPPGEWHSFLIELRWCRFIRQGWYESGGRFLRSVPTPSGHTDWSAAFSRALASA